MSRPVHQKSSAWGGCLNPAARLAALLFIGACATGTQTTPTETLPSHIYPLPLDTVLTQSAESLKKRGWKVQRSGNTLFTNWVGTAQPTQALQSGEASGTGSLVAYRVYGERIDAGYCTLRVERLVATPSTLSYGQKKGGHQVEQVSTGGRFSTGVHNEQRTFDPQTIPMFNLEDSDSANDARDSSVPSGTIVSQHQRDEALELELQKQIDPVVVATAPPIEATAAPIPPAAWDDAGVSAEMLEKASQVRLVAQPRTTDLAGVWTGTFTFRGKVTGAFSGEVALAVEGEAVEVGDFCPEGGGTLSLQGSKNTASWRGTIACPAIRMSGCPAATFTYNTVNATLNDETLTVMATGEVATRCLDSGGEMNVGGALSVVFVAQKADYIHIAVTKAKRATVCVWPSDWEDFASRGSMAMPEPQAEETAYLGIIRAKGSRLSDIQRLLRHCRQVVMLHGQPVSMKLAVTRTQHPESK
jgi:hypothetical protein